MASKLPTDRPLATAITGAVLSKLSSGESPLGPLREFQIKWLMLFTQHLFGSTHSSLTIDLDKKQLYLSPLDESVSPLPVAEFNRKVAESNAKRHARRLTAYLGIEPYKVAFKRQKPRKAITLT